MNLIELFVQGISYTHTQNSAYALLLSTVKTNRKLPIIIGAFEAQSIALAMEKDLVASRPLTHDLFKNFAESFSINVEKVIIHKLIDGVFYANVVCESFERQVILDARTSDAIALALRFKAPIFTYAHILEKAGITLDETEFMEDENESIDEINKEIDDILDNLSNKSTNPYANYSIEQLNELIEKAILDENYDEAAKIQEVINQKK
ncbi:bifunctional nuclease family protein [Capnocytophaga sp. ARDL2]|uniref:bifunctional nuclease family protein n=1 Tax=Capnocytophaga sp. ARDL2 TaxID=3238809 RepID=UPI003558286B